MDGKHPTSIAPTLTRTFLSTKASFNSCVQLDQNVGIPSKLIAFCVLKI